MEERFSVFEILNRGKVLCLTGERNANSRDVRWRCSSNDIRRAIDRVKCRGNEIDGRPFVREMRLVESSSDG